MDEALPGDPKFKKIFGFPGMEAMMKVNLKYINGLRTEQGQQEMSWAEYLDEVLLLIEDITNGTP